MAALEQAVYVQARTLALDEIFYVSALIVLPLALVAWLLPAHSADMETGQ